MTKRQISRLPVGTFIVLSWNDAPNSVALLIEKIEYCSGDMRVRVLHPNGRISSETHGQIVETVGRIEWDALSDLMT